MDKFEDMKGKTIVSIDGAEKDSEEIVFKFSDGLKLKMYHEQDCCEDVRVEDFCGNVKDILNTPVLSAYASSNYGDNECVSFTWTFYHISTIKGTATIRWYGESNGYYSETVDLKVIK